VETIVFLIAVGIAVVGGVVVIKEILKGGKKDE
jgi:hypothetical protein